MFHKKDQSIGNNLHWRAGEARDYRIVDGLGCPPENDLLDFKERFYQGRTGRKMVIDRANRLVHQDLAGSSKLSFP
jgi:hypothetical protein